MKYLLAFAFLVGSLVTVYGQWIKCQTLTGGSIITDIIEFNGKMYIAVNNGGLFRSGNEGDTWEALNAPYQGNFVHFVQHNAELLAVSYGTQLRTSDGDVWTTEDGPQAFVNDVSSDGTTIFAGTTFGIYVSTNAGADWSLIPDAATQVGIASVAVNGSVVWASADNSNNGVMFRSDNGGTSWTKVVKGTLRLTDLYIQGSDVYANAPYDAVYKSQDNGATWQAIHSSLNSGIFLGTANALYHFTDFHLSVSTSNGVSWTVNTQFTPNFSAQAIAASDNHFFVGFWGGGVYRNDGTGSVAWQAVNSGLAVTEVNDIQVTGNGIFVGTDFSFIRSSRDETLSWDQEMDGYHTPGSARVILSNGPDLYVGQGGGGIQRSANNGSIWEVKNNGLTNLNILALAATPSAVFAGTNDGIFRSTNRGDDWVKKSNGIPNSCRTLYADGHIIYVGTYDGLFRSENDGDSWMRISTGLPDESVGHIAQIGSTFFVATQFHGLYKTSNLGLQWDPVINTSVLSLAVRNSNVFLGSFNGKVFVSTDLGDTWTEISIGLPNSVITAIDFTEEHILAGTQSGYGLWLRKLTEVLAPSFAFYSNHAGLIFRVGEPIFVKSDQQLRTTTGAVVQSADLIDFITIKDSHGQLVTYVAEIGNDKESITINIDNASPGETYSVTLSPFKNASGLLASQTESDPFAAVDNFLPIVSNFSVTSPENQVVSYSASNFSSSFSDEDSDPLVKIKVKALPQHGTLFVGTAPVTINVEILVASLAQLTYSPENNFSGNDQWTWNGSDGKSYALLDVTVNMIITPVTGVDPLIPEGIQVYPNPVSGILHIEFPQHGLGKGNISFYDLSGRQVKNRTVDTDTMGSVDVDLSDLYGGFYILKIDHSGGQSQFRVVNH